MNGKGRNGTSYSGVLENCAVGKKPLHRLPLDWSRCSLEINLGLFVGLFGGILLVSGRAHRLNSREQTEQLEATRKGGAYRIALVDRRACRSPPTYDGKESVGPSVEPKDLVCFSRALENAVCWCPTPSNSLPSMLAIAAAMNEQPP